MQKVRKRRRAASLKQMGNYERHRSGGKIEIVRGFTEEEDARLLELRMEHPGRIRKDQRELGKPGGLAAIAKLMGRSKSSVQIRLDTLAKREEG